MAQKDKAFPALYWPPDGGAPVTYNSAADVPTGWLPQHPKHFDGQKKPPAASTPAAAIPMDKPSILAALKAGNVPYSANIGQQAAYNLLVSSLKKHLTEAGIQFPETATGPELLALLPKE